MGGGGVVSSWILPLSKADGTLRFLSLLGVLGSAALRIATTVLSLSSDSIQGVPASAAAAPAYLKMLCDLTTIAAAGSQLAIPSSLPPQFYSLTE